MPPGVQYLTDAEANRLAHACGPDFRQLVIGGLLTGCRYGKLIALTAADFDAVAGTICIRQSKSGKPRYVALSAEGIDFFRKLTLEHGRSESIFVNTNGTPWKRSEQQRHSWRPARKHN